MNPNPSDLIKELKTRILFVFGYDENLNRIVEPKAKDVHAPETDLSPRDFLRFAAEDIKSSPADYGLANCLSNCKRAIDSQLDMLISRLGYLKICREKRWSFPRKIEFIRKFGIIAPRILEKINKLRNILEHEYKAPSSNDIEDALDIAHLFVSYAEIAKLPGLNWGIGGEGGLHVEYDHDDMSFNFFREENKNGSRQMINLNCKFKYGRKEFHDLYRFFTETIPSLYKDTK